MTEQSKKTSGADDSSFEWNFIIRLAGEIGLKSDHTRGRFLQQLKENIESALSRQNIEFRLSTTWSRFDVETDKETAGQILARVAGVQGVLQARASEWETLDDIVELGEELFADAVAGHQFAVDARRVGARDPFPFDSEDLARALGDVLVEAGGDVDLDNPEVTAGVEVRHNRVFFFRDELTGPGGLPIGTQQKALSLISGGFDSAVASWMLAKRGIPQDFVFFNLAGRSHEKHVRRVLKELGTNRFHGYEPTLHVVDFRPVLAELKSNVSGGYWQVILKRLMTRAASQIAQDEEYTALVTGESAGQVSSQTLANLTAIERSVETPILRPLSGMNKTEITVIARNIETFDVSAGTPEFCSLNGGRPVTQGKADAIDRREDKIDEDLLRLMVKQRRSVDVLTMERWDDLSLEIERIPDGAAVVDLREGIDEEDLLAPGFIDLPFSKAVDNYEVLPRDRPYVLCCRVGLKSAYLAEKMQEAGFESYSFEGGIPALEDYVDNET